MEKGWKGRSYEYVFLYFMMKLGLEWLLMRYLFQIMNRQRNSNPTSTQRSIKSIRVIDKPHEDTLKPQPSTSRRQPPQVAPSQSAHNDEISTHRNPQSHRTPQSPTPNKQNNPNPINYQTVVTLLRQNQKTSSFPHQQPTPTPIPISASTSTSSRDHSTDKEIDHLCKMLYKLEIKDRDQGEILGKLGDVGKEYEEELDRNRRLRGELVEMKELMKALLLEREQERMFAFYQDE